MLEALVAGTSDPAPPRIAGLAFHFDQRRAGLSLRQALARAARDAPEPCREELRRAVDELALGSRLESALEGLVARVPVHDLRIMVTAILVQRRTGGNLALRLGGAVAGWRGQQVKLTAPLSARLDRGTDLAGRLAGRPAHGLA